jgi:hypothetical protein
MLVDPYLTDFLTSQPLTYHLITNQRTYLLVDHYLTEFLTSQPQIDQRMHE